jgi:hypothetical protein
MLCVRFRPISACRDRLKTTHSSQTAAAIFGQKQTIDMMVIRSSVLKIRVVFPLVMSRAWCAHKPIKELRMSKERAQI